MQEASFLQPDDRVQTAPEHHGEEKFLHGKFLSGAALSMLTAIENLFSVAESKLGREFHVSAINVSLNQLLKTMFEIIQLHELM